ncbi:MAG: ethylbenzene dehydrogenase-related protein [Halopseudomonas sp.]
MLNQTMKKGLAATVVSAALLSVVSLPAVAVDWSAAKTADVEVFFPGETSLEWMYSKRKHDGAARYKKRKKTCIECHKGDESSYGPLIVKGKDTESAPLGGRRGHTTVKAQAANDGTNLHIRLEWPKAAGAAAEKQDADFESKVTIMLEDGAIEEFTAGGCWAMCHIDAKKMPADGDKQKYITDSRTKMSKKKGGGDNLKSDAEIDALVAAGTFIEYWQARLNSGQPAQALDGYVLKDRFERPTPAISVNASEAGGNWVVEFSRPMAGGTGMKTLETGKTYNFGVALHDQNTAGRYHMTSFHYKLTIDGGDGDLIANQ